MARHSRQYSSAKKQTPAPQSLQRKDKAQHYSRPFPALSQSPQTASLNSSPVGYDGLSVPIMPKLTVGAVGDKYEQEADRVATQVVQQLNSPALPVQRDEGNDENTVHRQLIEGLNSRVPGDDNNTADPLNQSIQAKAFTTGQNVFFQQGAYAPQSQGGQELLAHELTHGVQQNSGMVQRHLSQPQALRLFSSSAIADPLIQRAKWKQESHGRWVKAEEGNLEASTDQTPVSEPEIPYGPLTRGETLKTYKNDALVTKEFVTGDHKEAISTYCKKRNVILSVRDTGSFSLDRIKEGAKPKPHTILEKSIKKSSLAKFHPEAAQALSEGRDVLPDINGVNLSNLKGFVGHWDEDTGELLGVRVDQKDVLVGEEEADLMGLGDLLPTDEHAIGLRKIQPFLEGKKTNSPYIPMAQFADFCEALPNNQWKQFLYTGDYDLHEIYKHNKTLVEGSTEKARLLTGINQHIAHGQKKKEAEGAPKLPLREGTIHVERASTTIGEKGQEREVSADTLHGGDPYAMIQHGDQMGYITNQLHEGRLKDETKNLKAQMVGAVAEESPSPLAWCVRGEWYVTKNKEEHGRFRNLVNVTASSGWSKKNQDSMRDGTSRTSELRSKKPSSKTKASEEERRKQWRWEKEKSKRYKKQGWGEVAKNRKDKQWDSDEVNETRKQPYLYR
jgi:hypothetical protein